MGRAKIGRIKLPPNLVPYGTRWIQKVVSSLRIGGVPKLSRMHCYTRGLGACCPAKFANERKKLNYALNVVIEIHQLLKKMLRSEANRRLMNATMAAILEKLQEMDRARKMHQTRDLIMLI